MLERIPSEWNPLYSAGAGLMAEILARALEPILAEPGLYRSERF